MSLFRSPGDLSSSDEDDIFENHEANDETNPSYHHENATRAHEGHSRQLSFDDAVSGSFEGALEHRDPEHEIAGLDAEGHAAMMTTALLEYYCLSKATEILNEQAGSHGKYTRDSPEARILGRRLYTHKSQFLSANGVVAAGVDGDDWEITRKYYRDTLDVLGLPALEGLDLNAQGPSQGMRSESRVVLSRRTTENPTRDWAEPREKRSSPSTENRPNVQKLLASGTEVGFPDRLPAAMNFTHMSQVQPTNYLPFTGLPGVYQPYKPSILMSRYATEFEEESLIGKGSYGVVYRARHYVDGQMYAIKKIPLNSKRLKQLQDRGLQELDHILKEIRTLARLDHSNVVRYFGAWAEYNTIQIPLGTPKPANKPLGLLSQGSMAEDESSHGIIFEESSHGIRFEASSKDEIGFVEAISLSESPESRRGTSNRTESRYSRKSFGGKSYDDREDNEVESIGRPLSHQAHGHAQTSTSALDSDVFSDGAGGNMSVHVDQNAAAGGKLSPITLHIQMSLHPLSLAKYLRPESEGSEKSSPRHCYHLIPSLKIFLGILSGVEYLHTQGIIHRDLKPANVFLSLSAKRDEIACLRCGTDGKSSSHYTIPRIGDFGLVADTSPEDENKSSIPTKLGPVGTEFYRPPVCQCRHDARGRRGARLHANVGENNENPRCDCAGASPEEHYIHESLDVYALGVILFELLYKFDTRMERQMVLSDLTCSPNSFSWAKRASSSSVLLDEVKPEPILPADFKTKVDLPGPAVDDEGTALSMSEKLERCIISMVEPGTRRRSTCKQVRESLEEILSLADRRTQP
ncbi:predicted protein [Uncinocarpus reesii 1704]|uniref:Protein kinase domain-containing protein n=1 Tax=Uncinocarpus reesii (strain UAMH 1704) TaxID=336963 RepID=C4JUP5_UNCRE|nr:uncharacterized protein UREG_04848 [Uncinocarpus reesii 1704]EEP80006.1 predicted protein [Uncinocarpus reesii 1704]